MLIPSFLKQALAPGSIGFLILSASAYVFLEYVWPRSRRVSRGWLVVIAGIYLVMSLPVVARSLGDRLRPPDGNEIPSLTAVDTLIIFDGDNRVGRALAAERVWNSAKLQVVYVLGEDWISDALNISGIPRSLIRQDRAPGNTRNQMEWVRRLLSTSPAPRVALIASRLQMPRVAALAEAAHLNLTLVASPVDDEPPRGGFRLLVPSYVGLRVSRDALYEHAALLLYSWRGWIR